MTLSQWWYLDLQADYPEIEMYCGGWKAREETALLELGDRVMDQEAGWLFTWIYSAPRDRIWAAASGMFRMIVERIRADRGEVEMGDVPAQWRPDVEKWDRGEIA